MSALTGESTPLVSNQANFDADFDSEESSKISTSNKKNVIMMVSDGFGPASETMARNYYTYVNKLPFDYQLPLDTILVGSSRTRSSDSFVTDSAAGATAFSCGMKTYNAAIGVDPKKAPCGTVLESAHLMGYKTGLVVTSRITHATPASFVAHVVHRDMENEIADQIIGNTTIGRTADLLFGGGLCHFLPNSLPHSCRFDNRNLIQEAVARGWTVGSDLKSFDWLTPENAQLPLMDLFNLDHMEYNIDRNPAVEPTLSEMSSKALEILKAASIKNDDKGFFLLIEGSRIDMAAHSNDPATHAHEILAYQDTIAVVKKFVDDNPGTVLISTSDHETGGLSVARQVSTAYPEYLWYPEILTKVQNSSIALALAIQKFLTKNPRNVAELKKFVKEIIVNNLGIEDFTEEDLNYLASNAAKTNDLDTYISQMVSQRAQLGWATHGHSAVDVNLYAYGAQSHLLKGNHENTDIGTFISDYLELDLEVVTEKLKNQRVIEEGFGLRKSIEDASKPQKRKRNHSKNNYEHF